MAEFDERRNSTANIDSDVPPELSKLPVGSAKK